MRFDLIVATVDRVDELGALLESLDEQTHSAFRVLVVDQNDDDRLLPVLATHPALDLVHLRSARGLNRARNVGLAHATAPLVAFPDDDCTYPPTLLERVGARLASTPELDGVTGRTTEPDGGASDRWPTAPRRLDLDNVWHGGNSASLFLRRALVERLGRFDERLGFGGGGPWELGDEIDLLVRAVLSGARLEQDPSFVVWHPHRQPEGAEARLAARRAGAGIGYVLGKNPVPLAQLSRRVLRPAGGVVVSLARLHFEDARLHATTFSWRLRGYAGGRRARARSSSNSNA